MSRLTDLIAQAKAKDPLLGADLDREFKVLSARLPFGLNFERHRPEAVELPLRPIRKGDKRLWQVKAIRKQSDVNMDMISLHVDERIDPIFLKFLLAA